MTDYPNIRIYYQLRPDTASIQHLVGLQSSLPPQSRGHIVPLKNLHLTLIHFGKAKDVYDVIHQATGIKYDDYESLLKDYIVESTSLLPANELTLEPTKVSLFGPTGNTLVIEYLPTAELLKCHGQLFKTLSTFLTKCGVMNIDSFVASDSNFMHASFLRPHVTIFKGYTGNQPGLELKPITLETMPTVYPPINN